MKTVIAGVAGLMFLILSVISVIMVISSNNKNQTGLIPDDEAPISEVIEIADLNACFSSEIDEDDSDVLSFYTSDIDDESIDSGNESANIDEFSDDEEEHTEPEPELTKTAYLTFDDGPSQAVTPGILDLLSEEGIKATFFVLPRIDVDDIFMRIINEGHEIGNHSYSHNFRRLYNSGIDSFRNDLIRMHDHLYDNYGYTTNIYRFPGGSMSWRSDTIRERIEVLEELGYIYFDWHIDSRDAHSAQTDLSPETLAANVLDYTNDSDHIIILMHDFRYRQTSLEALPIIITGLREMGYKFDIISNYPN